MRTLQRTAILIFCLLTSSTVYSQTDIKIDSNPAPTEFNWEQGEHLLNLVAWNVESGGNSPSVIAEQMKDFAACDIVALNEVGRRNIPTYNAALGEHFEVFLSETGRADHLAIFFDTKRFELLEKKEMATYRNHQLNNGTHRSPIYVRLKERKSGQELIFMTNHLARRDETLRRKQAAGLREWARDSSTPIIAMGDFNFDYLFRKQRGNESFNEFMRDGVWEWIKPDPFVDTNWSGDTKDNYPDSMLDFVFVANGAKSFELTCEIVVREGDFPDSRRTSDHRATSAKIVFKESTARGQTNLLGRKLSSFENGVVTYLESDGHKTEVKFSDLELAEQKPIMEATGWGRIWEDKAGTHHVIANLVEVKETSVVLEKADGHTVTVPLEKLSKIDRDYADARKKLSGALPDKFTAKVIGVSDGDTVTVLLNRKQYKVVIDGIDTPEPTQAFSKKSKKHLSDLVFGKQVTGERKSLDKYGRSVCSLSIDGKEVEKEMLKAGLAWHYLAFSKDPERQALEDQAKAEKLNIWSEAGPVAPWDWRKWGTAKRKNWLIKSTTPVVAPAAPSVSKAPTAPVKDHWLNTKSSVRHNAGCRWFENTKGGRRCTDSEGHACHQCGG